MTIGNFHIYQSGIFSEIDRLSQFIENKNSSPSSILTNLKLEDSVSSNNPSMKKDSSASSTNILQNNIQKKQNSNAAKKTTNLLVQYAENANLTVNSNVNKDDVFVKTDNVITNKKSSPDSKIIRNLIKNDYYSKKIEKKDMLRSGNYDFNGDGVKDWKDFFMIIIDKDPDQKDVNSLSNQDGRISPKIKQGGFGDCWLLSALISLNSSGRGRKIIQDSIKKKDFFSYVVTLKGVGKEYVIQHSELMIAKKEQKYSVGDDDVLLLEIAMERLRKEIDNGDYIPKANTPLSIIGKKERKNLLDDGTFAEVIYCLTGKNAKFKVNKDKNIDKLLSKIRDKQKYLDYCAVACFKGPNGHVGNLVVKDLIGNNVVLSKNDSAHAWSIKSVYDNYIEILNPWDASKSHCLSEDEFKKYLVDIEYFKYEQHSLVNVALAELLDHFSEIFICSVLVLFDSIFHRMSPNYRSIIPPSIRRIGTLLVRQLSRLMSRRI